jgi:mRNA interferase MazF
MYGMAGTRERVRAHRQRLREQGLRPVQDDRFDGTASVTVCPLTTRPVEAPLIRISVGPNGTIGIDRPSQIMVDKITTMPRVNVADHVGRLSDADLVRLDRALLVFLGLAD